jgi:hypothetical protein
VKIPELICPFLHTHERIITEAMTWEGPLIEPALAAFLALFNDHGASARGIIARKPSPALFGLEHVLEIVTKRFRNKSVLSCRLLHSAIRRLNIRSKFDEICDFLRSFVQERRLLEDLAKSDPKFPEIFFQTFVTLVEKGATDNFDTIHNLIFVVLDHAESEFAPGIVTLLATILRRLGDRVDRTVATQICDKFKLGVRPHHESFGWSLQVFRELLIFDGISKHFQALFDGLLAKHRRVIESSDASSLVYYAQFFGLLFERRPELLFNMQINRVVTALTDDLKRPDLLDAFPAVIATLAQIAYCVDPETAFGVRDRIQAALHSVAKTLRGALDAKDQLFQRELSEAMLALYVALFETLPERREEVARPEFAEAERFNAFGALAKICRLEIKGERVSGLVVRLLFAMVYALGARPLGEFKKCVLERLLQDAAAVSDRQIAQCARQLLNVLRAVAQKQGAPGRPSDAEQMSIREPNG